MEHQDPQYCVQQFRDCCNLAQVKRTIQAADETWTEAFIERGGLGAILDCLSALGEQDVDGLSDTMPLQEVVACLRAVINCIYGLESLVRRGGKEGSLVGKLVLGKASLRRAHNNTRCIYVHVIAFIIHTKISADFNSKRETLEQVVTL